MKVLQVLLLVSVLSITATLFCLETQKSKAVEHLSDSPHPPFD